MKKSMERLKVRVGQNLNITEKSVALTPDLLRIEETIGVYKQVFQTLQKKFSEGLQGFGKGTDGSAVERRLKKTGDFMLGQTLSEEGRKLLKQSPSTCLGQILLEMGGLCNSVAYNQVHYEISVEQLIVGKLQEVLTVDLPAILAGRKQLDRLVLELDTAKSRLERAREEEQSNSAGGLAAARIERLIEELDDTSRRVDQARDGLAADMMFFLARDAELAGLLTKFLHFKHQLNADNSTQLESSKPRLESILASKRGFPIFGTDLATHLESFGIESGIAYPIQLCVTKLVQLGLDEEGLFRLAAGSSKVRRLRAEIEAAQASMASLEGCDHHVLTATIKSYLRELPSPLFGDDLYADWLEAGNLVQAEERFDAIWNLLQSEYLPRENYRNIQYLFRFLNEVTKHAESNKMSASNLAIVITPNVIWDTEAVHDTLDVSVGNILAQVVELIIVQYDWFFQNDKPIQWAEKLTPIGNALSTIHEEPVSNTVAGLGAAASIPLNITSSPLPSARDKKSRSKRAPAPPVVSPGSTPSSSHNSTIDSTNPFDMPDTPPTPRTSKESCKNPAGSSSQGTTSPVTLRKNSPALTRNNDSIQRSKSHEGPQRSAILHPSQPPPKPPTNSGRNSTPAGSDTASSGSLYPDLSLESGDQKQQQQNRRSGHNSSGNSSQEENSTSSSSSSEAARQFPVPAPRTSKPALPSKPEGLARNMSIRQGSETLKTKDGDSTKL